MNSFQLLVSCILLFSILTFSVLFGHIPSLRHSPVGWLNHLITSMLPSLTSRLDQILFKGRVSPLLGRFQRRVMHERHPSVLIMYLFLFLGGVYIFLTRLWTVLSLPHHLLIPLFVALPLWTLYLSARTDPGYVTPSTHAHYLERYAFDGVLYRSGHECVTCLREKPARSKHCPLCDKCIAKHDHHCIWINGCVGERNMKFFLAFLLCNSVTFTYASVTLYLHFGRLKEAEHGEPGAGSAQAWLGLLKVDVLLGALFLFVMLCDAMVTAFFVYHAYLVWSGVTTNETLKFEDIKEAISAGEVDIYRAGPGRFKLDVAGKPDPISWSQLENVYDEGWRRNIVNILKA